MNVQTIRSHEYNCPCSKTKSIIWLLLKQHLANQLKVLHGIAVSDTLNIVMTL